MQKFIQKTNGKKTEATSLLMVAFQILMVWKPDLVSLELEKMVNITISSGVISSLLHRAWRNRFKLLKFTDKIKNKLWKKEKDF